MRLFIQILLLLATAPFLSSTASLQAPPEVTIELLEIDPAGTAAVPQAGWVAPLKQAPKNTVEVLLSPLFVLFLGILLLKARSVRQAAHEHEPHSAGPWPTPARTVTAARLHPVNGSGSFPGA